MTTPATTGPEAILEALKNIDLDALEQEQRAVIASGSKTKRSRAVRLLNSIQGLKKNELKPESLMLSSVPVIPPKFRPFSVTGNTFLPGDSNEVYRDLLEYRRLYDRTNRMLGQDGASEAYLDMYRAAKAAYGYGDSPNPKTRARQVKGFFDMVTGTNPKTCYDDKTEVLTKRGWLLFKDLKEDDQVGSVNPDTNAFVWSSFSNHVNAAYDGVFLVKFEDEHRSLAVTPNHRMWLRLPDRSEWEVRDALSLSYDKTEYSWTQTAAAAYQGDESTPTFENTNISPLDLATLVGWYISIGYCNSNGAIVMVRPYANNSNAAYAELDSLARRLKNAGVSQFVLEHAPEESDLPLYGGFGLKHGTLTKWLHNNTETSDAHKCVKRLSADIRNWPKELLIIMMEAFMRAERTKHAVKDQLPTRYCDSKAKEAEINQHDCMATMSKRLFDDLQEVCFKVGYTLLPFGNVPSELKYTYPWQITAEVFCGYVVREWSLYSKHKKICQWENYTGRIHCVQVPSGLLVVRRDWKVSVSGNSFYQQRMLSKPVDNVGRGVIIPDADLGMDDVGIPEDMAWKLYSNFVQRRLVRSGMAPAAALKHMKDRTPMARKALDDEMGYVKDANGKDVPKRPVVVTRSPAWHRTNVVGQRARIVDGDAIRINTFISEGMNADFNGDQMLGKILLMSVKNSDSFNLLYDLRCECEDDMVSSMLEKQIIPIFDKSNFSLFLCDLEDCPRGHKLSENPNGKNGHIDFYAAPDGMHALSFDECTGMAKWAPVFGISVHADREIELAHLSNGRQVVTDDDPRAIYGLDPTTCEMVRDTPTNAMSRRILVPCARDIAVACVGLGTLHEWQLGDVCVSLDFDFGYLLGALCGDGWWDKRDYSTSGRRVYIADMGGFVAAKVGAVLRRLFGDINYHAQEFKASELPSRYGDTVRHTFCSKQNNLDAFVEFCSKWMGGHGDDQTAGSGNKKLPDMFLLASAEFRRGVLTGMFDTDGSCSVSKAKGNDQLMCAITTTSVRLAADLKFLCLTLGVHASVSFSKLTLRGNKSWICSVSTVGLKEQNNLLRDLQNPDKRNNFLNTTVSGTNTSLVHNKAAVPSSIFEIVQRDLVNPKITVEDRATNGNDLLWKKHQQNMVIQWSKGKHECLISRPSARTVLTHLGELHRRRTQALDAAMTLLRSGHVEMTAENAKILREGVYATAAPFSADKDRESETYKLASIVKTATHEGGTLGGRRLENLTRRLQLLPVYRGALDSDLLKNWVRDILENDSITWATVVEVQKTGIRETGYDLTVPGYETFMSADGVILSNTMSVHVPTTDAAVRDVQDKMMASNMLWSIKQRDKTMGAPKHEQILGLTMGQDAGGKRRRFATEDDAMAAIESGQIDLNDDIEIG